MSARASFTWPRFAVEEVHRFLAILTGIFIVAARRRRSSSTASSRSRSARCSCRSRPPTGRSRSGSASTAAELMAAVGLTNLFRKQLPHTVWRRAHYLTLAVWALASLHGVLAGTDRGDPWFAGARRPRRSPRSRPRRSSRASRVPVRRPRAA